MIAMVEAPRAPALDVEAIRAQFPVLHQQTHGKPLVYMDSAATTQKPQAVIDAVSRYYEEDNANIHRGVYELSQRATDAYEGGRKTVARFLNARSEREIVFVRGTTEAINLVAATFGRSRVGAGDEILITGMEHHSNIVPWQLLCEQTGARLVVAPIDDDGALPLDELERRIGDRTKLLGLVHQSNALGTINPARRIVELAHARGVPVLLDAAQSVAHMPVDVQELGCDFLAFSGHKIFGPTGIGVLYGRQELLEAMPPWQGGGDMILSVSFERTTYNRVPWKFEAGTPHIAGVVGLAAAIRWLQGVGLGAVAAWESELLAYATRALRDVPGLRLIGTASEKGPILSFVLEGVHPHDIGTILDGEGVAIRAGHHCVQPVMTRFGVPATARASLALYNTIAEVDVLVRAIHKVGEIFR
ncbi:MAG: hypothetical protein AMXMBFR64_20900 [Myxococcales bacterium]